jgi:peptidoglycan-associated lipoprotein
MTTLRFLLIPVLLLSPACKKKAPEPAAMEMPAAPDGQKKMTTAEAVSAMSGHFARVHFETDSDQLKAEGKAALSANAAIMQAHPSIKVEVQGHADERGTVDYNVALGQRRAKSVADYMTTVGVSSSRVTTVSYGEEVPLDKRPGEQAWSQNRRCELRILSGDGAQGTL